MHFSCEPCAATSRRRIAMRTMGPPGTPQSGARLGSYKCLLWRRAISRSGPPASRAAPARSGRQPRASRYGPSFPLARGLPDRTIGADAELWAAFAVRHRPPHQNAAGHGVHENQNPWLHQQSKARSARAHNALRFSSEPLLRLPPSTTNKIPGGSRSAQGIGCCKRLLCGYLRSCQD